MTILDDIVAFKRTEVENLKKTVGLEDLQKRELFSREVISLKHALLNERNTGIIAEFKRKSPSKGMINANADVIEVTTGYVDGGASALSILTDESFFGGHESDLITARMHNLPILRKDFIIDSYQIFEAKAMGADVILLIAACLSPTQVFELAHTAKQLELEVLLELHAEEELGHICEGVDLVGINNRNLKTFEVDTERSIRMAEQIPTGKVTIAESGINNVKTIKHFREQGFKGFLIGEYFMKEKDPGEAFKVFAQQLALSRV
jgi:indole-3-glycerol phosphate synthase